MSNHLQNQTSPYLLQHAENPVDWYPWCEEAFDRARREDKPVFLSIGYSTCHWCHVMARESFADAEIAAILNKHFVSIKVDKEERPDIDSVYMSVCQAFTGNGGWPTSIFMTAEQKPFFAGTYFPKTARYGSPGLKELLLAIEDKWQTDRRSLLRAAEQVVSALNQEQDAASAATPSLMAKALELYKSSYDEQFGGFGSAPKFPAPHNLLFLLQCYQKHGDSDALRMAETTLRQMYRGGIFDQIGYGFCRYSTDRYFLAPHFEKMLCDNALLMLAYAKAYEVTLRPVYQQAAEQIAAYVRESLSAPGGGFYSAQDADSDGEEGKYYLFTPEEIVSLLGAEAGAAFNACLDITAAGNFEGKNIPNLLPDRELPPELEKYLPQLRAYRRRRATLHTDDKILTAWNSLLIAALCAVYRISRRREYLDAAQQARDFIEQQLCDGDVLYVSCRGSQRSGKGFLPDYAGYIFALLSLYDATLDPEPLARAGRLTEVVLADFFDSERGGFYLYSQEHETLIARPKDSYDGATPSGNSLMAYNLVRLHYLTPSDRIEQALRQQLDFMSGAAASYPAGYAMFLTALSDHLEPPTQVTVAQGQGDWSALPLQARSGVIIKTLSGPTADYPLLGGRTACYVCKGHTCRPPVALPLDEEQMIDCY